VIDERDVFEESFRRYEPEGGSFERLVRRRDRKRRNQRIAAGVVGITVFVAAIWVVTSGGVFDRSETSVVPGGDVTGPAETVPRPLVEPVPIGTVTRSGAGCALEIVAEPMPAGAGRLSLVNETNRWVSFELLRLDSEASFGQFEAFVEAFHSERHSWDEGTTPGALVSAGWFEREVGPGASGTITDNFTTGEAFAVVCLNQHQYDGPFGPFTTPPEYRQYAPFAVVGPIVVAVPLRSEGQ
jgi:hypothetical protein